MNIKRNKLYNIEYSKMPNLSQRYWGAILFFLFFIEVNTFAQNNIDCVNAFNILNPTQYCSNLGEFRNDGRDLLLNDGGCPGEGGIRFFSFVAIASDIDITVNGFTGGNSSGGSLINPVISLYDLERGCSMESIQLLNCEKGVGFTQIYKGALIPGRTYFFTVRGDNAGTFQVCLRNYWPPSSLTSDCSNSTILCDKSSFSVENIIGIGQDKELTFKEAPCFGIGDSDESNESNSVWFRWTCDEAGSLTFDLTPSNPIDDLDFVLYEMDGIDSCNNKRVIRCMASGQFNELFPSPCHGPTGLREGEPDENELGGCSGNSNNYVDAIQMESGKSYALGINNFTSQGTGLTIDFGGTGTFLGPKIEIKASEEFLKCDRGIEFTDSIIFDNGTIISKEWTFGRASNIETATGDGPHTIEYDKFGQSFISLSVETDLGCRSTNVVALDILECCAIDSDLESSVVSFQNPLCPDDSTGAISITGVNGSVSNEYQYRFLPNETLLPINNFTNLPKGNYFFEVFDDKGCSSALDVTLEDPEELMLDISIDDPVLELGDFVDGVFDYTPKDNIIETLIFNNDTIICGVGNCNSFSVQPFSTNFTAQIISSNGCSAFDSINLDLIITRPVEYPNAILTGSSDAKNNSFTLYSTKEVHTISSLKVFNRWGGLMFETQNIPFNQPELGWNGMLGNEELPSGIYIFVAEVLFFDGQTRTYQGDINLIRND